MSGEPDDPDLPLSDALANDPVAFRADAFGVLALRLDRIENPMVKDLGIEMLDRIIRSIELPKGIGRVTIVDKIRKHNESSDPE